MDYLSVYKDCYLIRAFERKVEKEFELGKMRGTTHGCIGQEIIPVLVMNKIDREKDYITGTHRCHGQVLAYTRDPYKLACEMMGKADGFNCGMGGSQHIKTENYITNGITGGMAAVGAGMALSLKKRNTDGIVISFLGDGGFQEGYVGETMNMASAMNVPILYILENNHYAISTLTEKYAAGSPRSRAEALNIKYFYGDVRNVDELDAVISEGMECVRTRKTPALIEIDTFRLCGHSKSDERAYMSEEEKTKNVADDPLTALRERVKEDIHPTECEEEISELIEDAFLRASRCREMSWAEYK